MVSRRRVLLGAIGGWAVAGASVRVAASGAADLRGTTDDPETRARAVEGQLMAPCCFSQTVHNHSSPEARRLGREIREALAEGRTEREIVDAYVERYGERILAAPRLAGSGALAWMVPPVFLGVGALVVAAWMRRRRRFAEPGPSMPFRDAEQRERLQAELARILR